jgi:hypothetical protein
LLLERSSAQLIREALKYDRAAVDRRRMETRHLQRRIGAAADLPWSVATTEDLRHPSTAGSQTLLQRLVGLWSAQLGRGLRRTATVVPI